jgi:hypothetical protein
VYGMYEEVSYGSDNGQSQNSSLYYPRQMYRVWNLRGYLPLRSGNRRIKEKGDNHDYYRGKWKTNRSQRG